MKKRLLASLLGAVLLLAACGGRSAAPSSTPAPTPAVSEGVRPTPAPAPSGPPVWGEQTSDCQRVNEDGVVLVQGRFSLPYIENAAGTAAYEAVNLWYLDLSAGLRGDTLLNEALAADDYAVSKATGDPFSGYSDEETFEIKYETAKLVNILRTHYGYMGGVYPSLLYLSDRFDLTTGTPLYFEDFFSDPAAAREVVLTEIVRQEAGRASEDALSPEDLRGLFRQDDFYLTEDALVFYYQPALLGAGTAHAPEFAVPLSLLGELYVPLG